MDNNIKTDNEEMDFEYGHWIYVIQDSPVARCFAHGDESSSTTKGEEFHDRLSEY
jgi:hypothetical protein